MSKTFSNKVVPVLAPSAPERQLDTRQSQQATAAEGDRFTPSENERNLLGRGVPARSQRPKRLLGE